MSNKWVKFSNPENLPVEKLKLWVTNAGVVREINALDPYWVEEKEMISYEKPPPFGDSEVDLANVETWIDKMADYVEDMKWLLKMRYFRFWSTMIHYKRCMEVLVSFLQEASPQYLPLHENEEVQLVYAEVRRFVLIVFSRLVTNRESESEWMSREYMAKIIYENFIFTLPIIWDICLVYGTDNMAHVTKLLTCVYTLQPRYDTDAESAIRFVNESFKYIIMQVNNDYEAEEPLNLPETFKGFGEIRRPSDEKTQGTLTFSQLKDLVLHLLDTALTLRIFIQAYPKSVTIFRKTNFINSIVQIYEYGIPELYERLEGVGEERVELESHIDTIRIELIDIFREILAIYQNAIFNDDNKVSHGEDYLTAIMEALAERLFIQDYQDIYPLPDDLDMLQQVCPDADTVKINYILQAIYSSFDEPAQNGCNPEDLYSNQADDNRDNAYGYRHDRSSDSSESETLDHEWYQAGPSKTEMPDNVKLDSLIQEVRDVLPDLGDGFVLKCLQHYNFDSAKVMNCILEDNLAEELKDPPFGVIPATRSGILSTTGKLLAFISPDGLDRSLPIIPEDPLDKNFLETGIARLNVFDGDEFDIMTRDDVDVSRIHRGKMRSKYNNMQEMLDDKTDIQSNRDLYNKFSLVCDEDPNMYDDDFDDAIMLDGVAPNPDQDLETRRPLVTPRALETRPPRNWGDEEEFSEPEEVEEPQPGSSKSKPDFCINPEVLRERREASMRARMKSRRTPPSKSADVTGKPRGQGQEKAVVVSRDRKEKNKSSRANHNRRQGATFKRSQGMTWSKSLGDSVIRSLTELLRV